MPIMIAVVQRVLQASVSVEDPKFHASIEGGLCVFLGIEKGDDEANVTWIAKKIANLRIFRDEDGKMNRSVLDTGGEILLISQFTLAGNCKQGNRPSFIHAELPELAEPMVLLVGTILEEKYGIPVQRGKFGAMMQIQLTNDGPVTLVLQQD